MSGLSFDDPSAYSPQLFEQFRGRTVKYQELNDYALNETPFTNPKSMLKVLEGKGLIQISSSDANRRKGTFNEDIRRNHWIAHRAAHIVIAEAAPDGSLASCLVQWKSEGLRVKMLVDKVGVNELAGFRDCSI